MSGRFYGRGRGRSHSGRNNFHRGGRITDVEERLRRPRSHTGLIQDYFLSISPMGGVTLMIWKDS